MKRVFPRQAIFVGSLIALLGLFLCTAVVFSENTNEIETQQTPDTTSDEDSRLEAIDQFESFEGEDEDVNSNTAVLTENTNETQEIKKEEQPADVEHDSLDEPERTQVQTNVNSSAQEREQSENGNKAVDTMLSSVDEVEDRILTSRKIAQDVAFDVSQSLIQAQSRSPLVAFFVGANYGDIKRARERLQHIEQELERLRAESDEVATSDMRELLDDHIATLEKDRISLQSQLDAVEGDFSLFGWLVKLFSR